MVGDPGLGKSQVRGDRICTRFNNRLGMVYTLCSVLCFYGKGGVFGLEEKREKFF